MDDLEDDTGHGRVVNVTQVLMGDELVGDHTTGATVLTVGDVAEFDETGGWLTIGSGAARQSIEYVSADEDTNQIELATSLAADILATSRVDVITSDGEPVVEFVADLMLDDADGGDPLPAVIDHALIDKLPEGVRSLEGESVEWVRDGSTLVVARPLGKRPEVDGQFVLDPLLLAFMASDLNNVPDSTWTRVNGGWDTEEIADFTDQAGGWWKVNTDGLYQFTGTASFAANGSGGRACRIGFEVAGVSTPGTIVTVPGDAGLIAVVQVVQWKRLLRGDRFSLDVRQTSGAALDLRGDPAGTRTALSARRMSA